MKVKILLIFLIGETLFLHIGSIFVLNDHFRNISIQNSIMDNLRKKDQKKSNFYSEIKNLVF